MSESTDEFGLLVEVPTDRELLKRFLVGDEAAFTQLIERHAELVRGICYRVLRNTTDCEDAFQATFFILASQAKNQAWQDSIGGLLHQVARRVSLDLKTLPQKTTLNTRAMPQKIPGVRGWPLTILRYDSKLGR